MGLNAHSKLSENRESYVGGRGRGDEKETMSLVLNLHRGHFVHSPKQNINRDMGHSSSCTEQQRQCQQPPSYLVSFTFTHTERASVSNPSSNLATISCSSSTAVVLPIPSSHPSFQSPYPPSWSSLRSDAEVQDGVLQEVLLSKCRSCHHGACGHG